MRDLRKVLLCATLFGLACTVNSKTADVGASQVEKNGVITVQVEPASGKTVIDKDIQNALDLAKKKSSKKYIIKVPKGKYTLSKVNGFHIYSNTTLNISGSTFKKAKGKETGALIQVGYPLRETKNTEKTGVYAKHSGKGYYVGKYNRGQNIKIIGGTFDGGTNPKTTTLCTFSHVKNIAFEGTTFKYRPKKTDNAHLIEFGGVSGLTLKNCKFYGNKKAGEAIQIESTYKGVAHSNLMGKLDGTKTKNVTITGCTISNFQYGIGTNHGSKKDIYKNMKIEKCTFNSISKYAVCAYNYQLTLKSNILKKSGKSWKARVQKQGTRNKIKMSKNKVK